MFIRIQKKHLYLVLFAVALLNPTKDVIAASQADIISCIISRARELDDRISPADVIATAVTFRCRNHIDQEAKVVDSDNAKRLSYSDRRKVIEDNVFGFALVAVLEGRVAQKAKD